MSVRDRRLHIDTIDWLVLLALSTVYAVPANLSVHLGRAKDALFSLSGVRRKRETMRSTSCLIVAALWVSIFVRSSFAIDTVRTAKVGDSCESTFKHGLSLDDGTVIKAGHAYSGQCMLRSKCKARMGGTQATIVRGNVLQAGSCKSNIELCCIDSPTGDGISASKRKGTRMRHRANSASDPPQGSAVSAIRGRKEDEDDYYNLEAVLADIEGLEKVKEELTSLEASVLLDDLRRQSGESILESGAPHMMFLGNPGTGASNDASSSRNALNVNHAYSQLARLVNSQQQEKQRLA